MENKKIFIFGILVFLSLSFISSQLDVGKEGTKSIDLIPTQSINYSTVNVNNSQYFQGYTPTTFKDYLDGLLNSSSWKRNGTNVILQNIGDKVGIGTATPNATLTVLGNATIGTLFVNGSNVGIGTTSPTQKLDVNGNINVTENAYVGNLSIGLGAGGSGSETNLIRPTSTSAWLNIKGGTGRAKVVIGNDILYLISGNDASGGIGLNYGASSSTNMGTTALFVNSTSGNIGIGTTAPTKKLDLNGSFHSDGEVSSLSTSFLDLVGGLGVAGATTGQTTNIRSGAGLSTTTDAVMGAGGSLTIMSGASGSLNFNGLSNSVFGANGGTVTINSGTAGSITTSYSNAAKSLFGGAGGDASYSAGAGAAMVSTGAGTKVYGGNGGSMSVGAGVGGTADIAGSGSGGNAGSFQAVTGAGGDVRAYTGATAVTGGNGGLLNFASGRGGAASVLAANDFGGGTATGGGSGGYAFTTQNGGTSLAQATGRTAGNVAVGGNSGAMTFTTGAGGTAALGAVTNTGGNAGSINFVAGVGGIGTGAGATTGTNGHIIFKSSTTEVMRISMTAGSVGNVGIGTTTPSSKLEIDGDVYINGSTSKLYLGVDKPSSIYYDGTNMKINPKEVGSGRLDVLGNLNVTENITAVVYKNNIDWVYTIIGMSGNTACDNLDNKVTGYSYTCQTCIDTAGATQTCATTLVTLNANCACEVDI